MDGGGSPFLPREQAALSVKAPGKSMKYYGRAGTKNAARFVKKHVKKPTSSMRHATTSGAPDRGSRKQTVHELFMNRPVHEQADRPPRAVNKHKQTVNKQSSLSVHEQIS